MQEAFLKLWERWDRIDSIDDPQAYLFRVALNGWRMRVRTARRAATRTIPLGVVHDAYEDVDLREDVRRMLRAVTPRQRLALVLLDLYGYGSEEAARIMGIRPSTVRALATQGRAVLRNVEARMADIKELFDMVTKQTEPDLDSWKEQEDRQRKRARSRKIGAFAVAAVIVVLAAFAVVALRQGDGGDPPASQPSQSFTPVGGAVTHWYLDIATGERTPVEANLTGANLPDVSPNGESVVWFTFEDGIYVSALDGSGEVTCQPRRARWGRRSHMDRRRDDPVPGSHRRRRERGRRPLRGGRRDRRGDPGRRPAARAARRLVHHLRRQSRRDDRALPPPTEGEGRGLRPVDGADRGWRGDPPAGGCGFRPVRTRRIRRVPRSTRSRSRGTRSGSWTATGATHGRSWRIETRAWDGRRGLSRRHEGCLHPRRKDRVGRHRDRAGHGDRRVRRGPRYAWYDDDTLIVD